MKVIFCDVDGVLNNAETKAKSPSGYTGVSDELIQRLKRIVSETGAVIVLSSDWRLVKADPVHGKDYRYLVRRLRFVGHLRIEDHTDDIAWRYRGLEIRQYVDRHPQVTEFVVLDDLPFSDFPRHGLLGHLVLTDRKKGLTDSDVERAIRILKGEKVTPCERRHFDPD